MSNFRKHSKRFLLALVLGYVAVLILLPIGTLVVSAFSKGIIPALRVLGRPDVLHAFGLTLGLSSAAVIFNAVFGLAVAWVLVRQRFPGRNLLNALVDLPFAVSPVVAGYMLILLFGRTGWFYPFLSGAGLKVVFALPGMAIATCFVSLPFVIREVMPILQEIGVEEEHAARTLGANGWQIFWRVTFPAIRWGLLYGVTLTFARALGEFGALFVVSGAVSGETETATLFIFRAMDERMYQEAYVVSLALAAVSLCVLLAIEALRKRVHREG